MYTEEKIKERQAAIAAKLREVKKQNEGVGDAFKAHDPSEFSFTKSAPKLKSVHGSTYFYSGGRLNTTRSKSGGAYIPVY